MLLFFFKAVSLMSSTKYAEKQVGYMVTSVLLNEVRPAPCPLAWRARGGAELGLGATTLRKGITYGHGLKDKKALQERVLRAFGQTELTVEFLEAAHATHDAIRSVQKQISSFFHDFRRLFRWCSELCDRLEVAWLPLVESGVLPSDLRQFANWRGQLAPRHIRSLYSFFHVEFQRKLCSEEKQDRLFPGVFHHWWSGEVAWSPRMHLRVCSQALVEAVQELLKVLYVRKMPKELRLLIVQNFITPGVPINSDDI